MDTAEEILAHHGVKGMKWGVRKQESSSSLHPKNPDAARAGEVHALVKKHGTSAVSNADLKFLNERATLESKYKTLFPRKQSLLEKGAREVANILFGVGKQQAQSAMNKEVGKLLNKSALETAIEIGKHSPGYGRHLIR